MPLNLSLKQTLSTKKLTRFQHAGQKDESSESDLIARIPVSVDIVSTPPPLRAANLKVNVSAAANEQTVINKLEPRSPTKCRSHSSIIWSPASMCEKTEASDCAATNVEYSGTYAVDPIVRKFKYERRASYPRHSIGAGTGDASLQSPLSSTTALATQFNAAAVAAAARAQELKAANLEIEVAQQQIYAHRTAFMAGLATGNNFEMLQAHLKELQSRADAFVQNSNNNNENSMLSRNASRLGRGGSYDSNDDGMEHMKTEEDADMAEEAIRYSPNNSAIMHEQHQQHQQQQLQHYVAQQQHQHPDSTAIISAADVHHRSYSCGSEGESEKRGTRNFQVSFWQAIFI